MSTVTERLKNYFKKKSINRKYENDTIQRILTKRKKTHKKRTVLKFSS